MILPAEPIVVDPSRVRRAWIEPISPGGGCAGVAIGHDGPYCIECNCPTAAPVVVAWK
jgi:hypothetical protein